MKGDWTDKLKTRLEGHEMTPPSDLWTGINEQMGFATHPARASVVAFWRWATVAAIVLALVGFFAIYENNEADYSIPNELITEEAIIPKNMEETIIEKQPIAKKQHNIIPQVKPQESVGVTIVEEYVEVVDMTAVQQEKSQIRPTTKEVVETYHHYVPIQQTKAKKRRGQANRSTSAPLFLTSFLIS